MNVIQTDVQNPCHGLFHLFNVFKITASEALIQPREQPKVTGRMVWTEGRRGTVLMSISVTNASFVTEYPGNKHRTNLAHVQIFVNNYVYSYQLQLQTPWLSLSTHDNHHPENCDFSLPVLTFLSPLPPSLVVSHLLSIVLGSLVPA